MPMLSNPPDPTPKRPRLAPPPGACDCHVHLFGPADKYPYAPEAGYHAHDATPDDLIALQDRLGLTRAVLIQPTALGRDNSRLLDALAAFPDRFRGVVVPPDDVTDADLDAMHDLGVRGVRFAMIGKYAGGQALDGKLVARIAERGWHAQIWCEGEKLTELRPRLEALPCDVVFDHMGHLPARSGVANPAFASLLDMLDNGRTWVKISGPMRFSAQDRMPYSDTDAFARALIARRPDRCVWGSDWPHIAYNHGQMPNDADLLDQLLGWAPDEAVRRRLLTDNPARLYGFEAPV